MKTKKLSKALWLLYFFMIVSCSQNDILEQEICDNTDGTVTTRAANDTLLAERLASVNIGSWNHSEYYVDAPGNIYGMYSKGNLHILNLSNEWFQTDYGVQSVSEVCMDKPCYGFCFDLNENGYYITSNNLLIKQDRSGKAKDLTDKFPENTVFLGITSAQINGNIFVSTAEGNGDENPWQSYSTQIIYRISGTGTVTKIAENIQAPLIPNPSYTVTDAWGDTYTYKMFTYTSVLSKRQGTYLYGMDSNNKYFMVNTSNGEVTYYTPKVPIQFLTAGTSYARALALSGRQILELRPNAAKDIIIGTLPSSIPNDATLLNFYTNADATIFYVVALHEYSFYGETPCLTPVLYRLRLNN